MRCTGNAEEVAGCLNERYRRGKQSSEPAEAGILVSQWDIQHIFEKPWLPYAPDWDVSDHYTGTLKNDAMPTGLWNRDLPGFVVSPSATRIFCGYSADGTTQGDLKACRRRHREPVPPDCIPGCNLDFQPIWCDPTLCNDDECIAPPDPTHFLTVKSVTHPGREITSDCAWPATSIQWMLKQQILRRHRYNEVVFDSKPIIDGFPLSLEAFFIPEDGESDPDKRDWIKSSHRKFIDEFKTQDHIVPILTYDTHTNPSSPFRVPKW